MKAPRTSLILWFLAGVAVALFLMATQARAVGGWTGLLSVGEESRLRPLLTSELPGLVVVPDAGHDGQIYYAIGLDLSGERVPELLPEPGLRYRRILFPAVASGLGLLGGYGLLWGEVVVAALSIGVATAALRRLAEQLGLRSWIALSLLLTPGIWLSLRHLTPDPLGIALALIGLVLLMGQRHAASVAALALAPLAKETLLLVAWGLAFWYLTMKQYRRAVIYLVAPAGPLALWTLVVSRSIPGGLVESNNLSPPFAGLVRSIPAWLAASSQDQFYVGFTLLAMAVATGLVLRTRSQLLRSLTIPWLALAVVSSDWIWNVGNGVARNFAMVPVWATLLIAYRSLATQADIAPMSRT